jgi:hypothetical protein
VIDLPKLKNRREELRAERERESLPSMDSAESSNEFSRFEDLTRKLVKVPNKQLDEKLKKDDGY